MMAGQDKNQVERIIKTMMEPRKYFPNRLLDDNFDPNKSRNPFAYFTQIIYYAFLRRIQKEKKQVDIKTKIIEKSGHNELFSADAYGNKAEYEGIKTSLEQRYRQ